MIHRHGNHTPGVWGRKVKHRRNTYKYKNIGGAEWLVTEACAKYLDLLRRMVEKFNADHPIGSP